MLIKIAKFKIKHFVAMHFDLHGVDAQCQTSWPYPCQGRGRFANKVAIPQK